MGQAILKRDKEGVLSVFDLQVQPYWSLWENTKEPSFSCADPEDKERRKMLVNYLDIILESGSNAPFTLKFHDEVPKGKRITNQTPVIGSLPFRFGQAESEMGVTRGAASGGNMSVLTELFREKMERLDDKWQRKFEDQEREHQEQLAALEEELEGKPEADETMGQVYQWGDTIGSLGNKYPWLQENINKLFSTVNDFLVVGKHKMNTSFRQGGGAGQRTAAGMGNVDTTADANTVANNAIQKLMLWYTSQVGDPNDPEARKRGAEAFARDMHLLANLTEDDEVMHLALSKLRKLA